MSDACEFVQNGTYKRLGKSIGILNAIDVNHDKNLGQIRVIENDSGIVVSHVITKNEHYLNQYSIFAVKTAQSTVEMCRVVYEAKQNMNDDEFIQFCKDIGRKGEDSTIRKYIIIGNAYDRLINYANLLPNSWTSIYTITQLPSDVFEALALTGNSMANMTGAQIQALMSNSKKQDQSTQSKSVSTDESASHENHQKQDSCSDVPQTDQSLISDAVSDSNTPNSSNTAIEAVASSDSNQIHLNAPSDSIATSKSDHSDDEPSNESDQKFAEKATSSMLERISNTSTTSVKVEEEFKPYEIAIRFNSKMTDDATKEFVELLMNFKSKHRLDFEFKQNAELIV